MTILHIAAPDDYSILQNVLTFMPGVNVSCTSGIRIADDSILEDDETFSVVLSTADLDISIDLASATVTIVDNDGKIILFVINYKFITANIILSTQLQP